MFMTMFLPARSDACRAERRGGAPGRAPAPLDAGNGDERERGERGEDEESRSVAAGVLLRVAKAGGEIETAEPAGHADDAGHHADLALKPLRHELEHRAVAHPERQHCNDEDRE